MPQIIILPHAERCPEGAVLEANAGDSLIEVALDAGISIEHACEKACACTTCHVVLREGFDSLEESDELEDDLFKEILAGLHNPISKVASGDVNTNGKAAEFLMFLSKFRD